ncbi:deoxyribodipyrimidine photo-lyase [Inhella sp.]|uniref:cryptochrome/photolyase family protein n=1 Tax=Inhella sp. TaxID=1921806 RepID=UPI0035AF3E93
MTSSTLVWLRRDLRLHDHAALHAATTQGEGRVHLAFVFDTEILDALPRQDRRVELIHCALQDLQAQLVARGASLIVRLGRAAEEIPRLANELAASRVVFAHDDDPYALRRDAAVRQALPQVQVDSVQDVTVFERRQLLTGAGQPYTVFTPYRRSWQAALRPAHVEAREPRLERLAPSAPIELPSLPALGFEATDLHRFWRGGSQQAQRHLQRFVQERLPQYASDRERPALPGTSGLSAALRFGLLSVRELVRAAQQAGGEGGQIWLSELIWRDFFHQVLHHHPGVVDGPLKPAYAQIPWVQGELAEARFQAWCEGRTGLPLVDAGMRQLRATGFMHNRLRMLTASFLCKQLGVDWRRGEAWFAQWLLDFDLAANSGGWQWSAGCGCDAQPWFRVFNPQTQAQKFDPDGAFQRRWLPELGGPDYPAPMVDLAESRLAALARYGILKAGKASEDFVE